MGGQRTFNNRPKGDIQLPFVWRRMVSSAVGRAFLAPAGSSSKSQRMASTLKLRSRRVIALAYVMGPAVGLIAWCGSRYFFPLSYRPMYFRPAAEGVWILTVLLGTIICLAVELVLVTPLLIAFNRYR